MDLFLTTDLLLHFLEGKTVMYHQLAYDPKIEETVRNFYFGCHGFFKFRVVLGKNSEISKEYVAVFIDSNCKKLTSLN